MHSRALLFTIASLLMDMFCGEVVDICNTLESGHICCLYVSLMNAFATCHLQRSTNMTFCYFSQKQLVLDIVFVMISYSY